MESILHNRPAMTVVGLISDTHGLLRPEAVRALQGSELIVHAGDVGKAGILDALREVAPVVAIKGNVDTGAVAASLPATIDVEVAGRRVYVLHDVHDLGLDPAVKGFAAVISGHSHQPSWKEQGGVLYINPGSAGPRRFRLPITVARLHVGSMPWRVEIVELC